MSLIIHKIADSFERVANRPSELADRLLAERGSWLIWGPPGTGKSTLVGELAARLALAGSPCPVIAADPGLPPFGVSGALALGQWGQDAWLTTRLAPLCTLDAVRFRLPLVMALRRLAAEARTGPLLVDAPGGVRGPAAVELLIAMAEATGADRVLAVLSESGTEAEAAHRALGTLGIPVLLAQPSPLARRLGRKQRARKRTRQWDAWLAPAEERWLDLTQVRIDGHPPRAAIEWTGRQLALTDRHGRAQALGEALELQGDRLRVRLRRLEDRDEQGVALLVRDAGRGQDGLLGTIREPARAAAEVSLPPDLVSPTGEGADPACFVHLGSASALLVNGLFGDPLLHIRLRQSRRSLLLDLGDSGRLPAKIAHQVSDVFISHAHMDHIGGFLWFLRSRLGETDSCRLYGPPGLSGHIASFIAGIRWDRILDRGPGFELFELHGDRLLLSRIQVGKGIHGLGERPITDGCLLEEPGFRVRAITLDHGIPVLAFAFEAAPILHVRKDRLADSGLPVGPWIGDLKHRAAAGETAAEIQLPAGRTATVGGLAAELIAQEPARRLVYATDLADTADNRRRLGALARGADVLICEAAFTTADREQALRTGHLTARACGEIAASAAVARLIPFHFSRRYEGETDEIYGEISGVYRGVILKPGPGSSA